MYNGSLVKTSTIKVYFEHQLHNIYTEYNNALQKNTLPLPCKIIFRFTIMTQMEEVY